MQRLTIVLLVLGLLGLSVVLALAPQAATAQDGSGTTRYTVQPGDTLYAIARRFNVTVASLLQANPTIVNPNLIYVGQVLTIPAQPVTGSPTATVTASASPGTATATPPPTIAPGTEIRHRVQAGENLFRIALRYGTTVQAIMQLNDIANPNVIYVGRELRIITGTSTVPLAPTTTTPVPTTPTTPAPATTTTAPPATQAAASATTETPSPGPTSAAPAVLFDFGVQVELRGQDTSAVVGRVTELGVRWVKQEVQWSLYEPSKGALDFSGLDTMVNVLDGAGLNILLTVTTAPNWARASSQESGPPNSYQDYASFVGALATHYAGRVDAYEIWSEPNVRPNWNGKPISGTEYVGLLRLAYAAIKTADPRATVVTAGLSPTGLSDGVNAIDDRVFLRQMYQAGVAEVSDAIGAHPFGWANAPDSTCCETDPTIRDWNDHKSFFFRETLEDYRAIMTEFNDSGTFIWVTGFGWGSSDGFQLEVDPAFAFVDEVNLDEQANYTIRAFQIGQRLTYIGPMFAWNLNYCQVYGLGAYQCYWSMLNPAGDPRPVFLVLRDLSK